MREQKKKIIDGMEYGLFPVSPFKSAPLLTRLMKIFGPTLLNIIIGGEAKKQNVSKVLDTNLEDLLPAITAGLEDMFDKIGEDEIEYVFKKLFIPDYAFCDGKKITNIDAHFADKSVFHLLKVLRFGLEANFGDFLEGVRG